MGFRDLWLGFSSIFDIQYSYTCPLMHKKFIPLQIEIHNVFIKYIINKDIQDAQDIQDLWFVILDFWF
jgi:hypothetical protein